MSYRLGIDLGTTFTAAAVCDVDTAEANPEVIPLGTHKAEIPSVVFVADEGSFLFGDAAWRRCVTDPGQVIREFKRRIGDPIPIVANGALYEPHIVAARFVRWVVDQVAERKGSLPDAMTVTHPAAWGEHKSSLLLDALRAESLDDVELMTEPEAATIAYGADLKVDPGSTVAVYDLGGGTFDAAVVHGRDRGRFELVGAPEGLEALGGADFDEAIFEHVRAQLAESWGQLDVTDPSVLSAVAALRRECTEAKEALSSDTEVTVPVMLPGVHSQVRTTRGEFEEMIAPAIGETLQTLRHTLSSADVAADDLAAILLVGGSSRIPVIAQQLSEQFGRPVVADADPKSTVALGAALSGLAERAAAGSVGVTRVDLAPVAAPAITARPAADDDGAVPATLSRRRRTAVLVGVVLLALFTGASTLAFDPFESSILGGAKAAAGLPGAGDDQAVGVPVGGDESSSAARAGGEIDPWTGRPVEEDGTTTPGPERKGSTPVEGDPSVTDLGPPPPLPPASGGGGSQDDARSGDGGDARDQRVDRPGGSGTDGTQQDTTDGSTDGTQRGETPADDSQSQPSDPPADEPDQSTGQDPPPDTTEPPASSDTVSPNPDPTSQNPPSSETNSDSTGGSSQDPASSQPVGSPATAGSSDTTSGTAG